jgi:hypothetical protein
VPVIAEGKIGKDFCVALEKNFRRKNLLAGPTRFSALVIAGHT